MRRNVVLLGIGIVLTGLNLRIAVASVPPLLDDLERDLGMTPTVAGLLTTLPVLCFGLLAPLAPALTRRTGAEAQLLVCLACVAGGILLRWIPSTPALFAGTLVAGAGIAIGNVVVPTVIKARFPARVGLVTGLYVTAINGGAALGGGLTVPLDHALGRHWAPALAVWALPAAAAAVVVAVALATGGGHATARGGVGDALALLGDRLAWQVTLFFGFQSILFYTGLAWLPSLLRDHGYSAAEAGALLSVYAIGGIPASLAVPVLAARMRNQQALAIAVGVLEVLAVVGLLVAPGAAYLWVPLFALGQGGTFSLALTVMQLRAPDPKRGSELSGMTQSIGYCIAATGPLLAGALHDATGGWTAPLLLMLGLAVPMMAFGAAAGRARFVRATAAVPTV